ncbi:DUF3784 domain-containing protein [Mucilaginibacter sp. SP1R1]|uniref:DUF3784 domain-containing protein n=1 Tax=Mucilaginibacter sp. SP1R1 TaxID=2723091 RepID=UPI00161AB975|nr:DUF3784 domain-containing protein [Mucilaginibacter sp. SP1R1]MBB6147855.1 putative membrane protein [Mucilaginibacter sp. SP1R1]
MGNGNTLLAVIEALAAALIIFLAYLIKYKHKVGIIAGYDEHTCRDKIGLANWVGGTLILTGIICLLLAILLIFLPNYTNLIMLVYGVTILIGSVTASIGGKKYQG